MQIAISVFACLVSAVQGRSVLRTRYARYAQLQSRQDDDADFSAFKRKLCDAAMHVGPFCSSKAIASFLLAHTPRVALAASRVQRSLSARPRRRKSLSALLEGPDALALLQADDAASFLETATSALGYTATLLSLGIYTPQVVRLWGRKTAEGLAESTWVLKLFAVTSTALFSLHSGLPVTAWADVVSLTLQALAVHALLISFGSEGQRRTLLPASAIYFVWILAFVTDAIPEEVFSALQSFAAASLTFALAPQILLNFQKGEAGNFSPLTAALVLLLCSIRVFTTVETGASPILIATWAGAATANAILTAQIAYFGTQKGIKLADIFSSDLQSS